MSYLIIFQTIMMLALHNSIIIIHYRGEMHQEHFQTIAVNYTSARLLQGVCVFHYFIFPSIVRVTLPYGWVGYSGSQCPGISVPILHGLSTRAWWRCLQAQLKCIMAPIEIAIIVLRFVRYCGSGIMIYLFYLRLTYMIKENVVLPV